MVVAVIGILSLLMSLTALGPSALVSTALALQGSPVELPGGRIACSCFLCAWMVAYASSGIATLAVDAV